MFFALRADFFPSKFFNRQQRSATRTLNPRDSHTHNSTKQHNKQPPQTVRSVAVALRTSVSVRCRLSRASTNPHIHSSPPRNSFLCTRYINKTLFHKSTMRIGMFSTFQRPCSPVNQADHESGPEYVLPSALRKTIACLAILAIIWQICVGLQTQSSMNPIDSRGLNEIRLDKFCEKQCMEEQSQQLQQAEEAHQFAPYFNTTHQQVGVEEDASTSSHRYDSADLCSPKSAAFPFVPHLSSISQLESSASVDRKRSNIDWRIWDIAPWWICVGALILCGTAWCRPRLLLLRFQQSVVVSAALVLLLLGPATAVASFPLSVSYPSWVFVGQNVSLYFTPGNVVGLGGLTLTLTPNNIIAGTLSHKTIAWSANTNITSAAIYTGSSIGVNRINCTLSGGDAARFVAPAQLVITTYTQETQLLLSLSSQASLAGIGVPVQFTVSHQNLVVNPNFALPVLAPGTYRISLQDAVTVPAWNFNAVTVATWNFNSAIVMAPGSTYGWVTPFPSPEQQSAIMQNQVVMNQTVFIPLVGQYTLSFMYAGRPNFGFQPVQVTLCSIANGPLLVNSTVTPPSIGWTSVTLGPFVVPLAGWYNLNFTGLFSGDYDTAITTIVLGQAGVGVPRGQIQLFDNGQAIGSCNAVPFSAAGTANCSVILPSPGQHNITALYANNTVYTAVSLGPVTVDVILCSPGSFSSTDPTTSPCTLCSVGTYSNAVGATSGSSCLNCSAGTSTGGLNGATNCTVCEPGYYSEDAAAATCSPCGVGQFQLLANQTSCLNCSAGSAAVYAASTCDGCFPGYYSESAGASICSACTDGHFQPQANQSGCLTCPAGTSTSGGATSCGGGSCGWSPTFGGAGVFSNGVGPLLCPIGSRITTIAVWFAFCWYTNFLIYMAATCSDDAHTLLVQNGVPSGPYIAVTNSVFGFTGEVGAVSNVLGQGNSGWNEWDFTCPGSSQLTGFEAAVGFGCSYAIGGVRFMCADIGSSSCTGCDPGTYAATNGSSACGQCDVGRYQPLGNQTACTLCAAGSYNELIGQTSPSSCLPCPSATQSALAGAGSATNCSSCPAGSASSNIGVPVCPLCSPGTYQPSTGTLQCLQCPIGTFQPLSNVTSVGQCLQCPTGRVGSFLGMASCTICPAGQSNGTDPTGSPVCVDCGPGTSSSGGSTCVPCAPGYMSLSGAPSCTACLPGQFYDSISHSCLDCPVGQFSANSAQTSCSLCDLGKFTSAGGAAFFCQACPPGQGTAPDLYSGQLTCYDCVAGTASAGGGGPCALCPAGQVATANNSAFCTPCSPGTVPLLDDEFGVLTCQPCAPGTAAAGTAAYCTPCSPGFYADQNASYACSPCVAGSASNITGRTTACDACAPGQYSPQPAQTACLTCAVNSGLYSSGSGSSTCASCSLPAQVLANGTNCVVHACEDNYLYDVDSGQCSPCPLGLAGVGVCAVCAAGFYTPQPGSDCIPCVDIEGLICSGGLANVAPGYWAFLAPADGSSQVELYQTAPCPLGFCPGSALQTQQTSGNSSNSTVQLCTPPRLNSISNVLCGSCVDGYVAWGNECVPCTVANGELLFAGLVVSFALVLFLLYSSSGASAGGVAILLFFGQTAMLEIGSVTAWLAWMQFINLSSTSTSQCLAPLTPYQQTLLSLIIPVILMVELAVIAAAHYAVRCWVGAQPNTVSPTDQTASPTDLATRPTSASVVVWSQRTVARVAQSFSMHLYVAGAMSILLFCYTQVAIASIQYIYCVDVGDARVVFTAPTIDCQSNTYRSYMGPVALALALYIVGFPLSVFVLLWVNKETLFAAVSATSASNTKSLTGPLRNFMLRWSPLFAMFHPRAWFWQPLLLVRRSLFVLASVLLAQQPLVRFMAFTFLNFGSLLLHQMVRPFDTDQLNRVESISYVLLVCISVLLTGYQPPYSMAVQGVLLLLVLPPVVGMGAFVLRQQWRDFRTQTQRRQTEAAEKQMEMELATVDPNPMQVMAASSTLAHSRLSQESIGSRHTDRNRGETVELGDIAISEDDDAQRRPSSIREEEEESTDGQKPQEQGSRRPPPPLISPHSARSHDERVHL